MKRLKIYHHTLTYSASLIIALGMVNSCTGRQSESNNQNESGIKKVKPEIVKVIPHDPTAFTQGLFYHKGKLYESTGIHGRSTIRIVDTNGIVEKSRSVPHVFAEGCALLDGFLYQITWQEGICIKYNIVSLEPTGTLSYKGEGWGLTSDEVNCYMSNGSDTIVVRDAQFGITRRFGVTVEGKPLKNINELEFVDGVLFANVWFSDYVFVINCVNGSVERIIDCTELVTIEKPSDEQNVLNGIAYNPENRLFFLTGKNWKNMFIVKIPEA